MYRNRFPCYQICRYFFRQSELPQLITKILIRNRDEWIQQFGAGLYINCAGELGYWRASSHQDKDAPKSHLEARNLRALKKAFSRHTFLSVVPVEVSLNGVEVPASGGLGDCIAVNSETCLIVRERYQCVAMNSHIGHRISVRAHRRRIINRPVNGRIVVITSWNAEKVVGTVFRPSRMR